jgi:hypothetical protein
LFASLKNIISHDNDFLITEKDHFSDIARLITEKLISHDIYRRITEKYHFR